MNPMTEARAREILGAYGAAPERWPQDEREALAALLAANAELRQLADREARLDARIALPPEATSARTSLTVDNVLSAIDAMPEQPTLEAAPQGPGGLERLIDWLIPSKAFEVWRPALAAVPLLVMGFYIGANTQLAADSWESWDETEQYVMVPTSEGFIDG